MQVYVLNSDVYVPATASSPAFAAFVAGEVSQPIGKFTGDFAAFIGGIAEPAGNFITRSPAANAKFCLQIDHANLDARAFNGGFCPVCHVCHG